MIFCELCTCYFDKSKELYNCLSSAATIIGKNHDLYMCSLFIMSIVIITFMFNDWRYNEMKIQIFASHDTD